MNQANAGALVKRLQDYLTQDPENWRLRADLFDAALMAGDFATAGAQVDWAAAARPGDAPWRHRQALLLLATHRYPEAQKLLEGLLAEERVHPAIRHNLAWALFSQQQYQAAALVLDPLRARADAAGDLGWALWLRCQHRLKREDVALAELAAAAATRELPPDAWGVASLIALDVNRASDARAWAERALAGGVSQLEAFTARGTIALLDQDPKAALEWFDRALGMNPQDGRTWSGVASARMLAMDLPGALEAFARSVATMPDHVGTWLAYGWCRLFTGDPAGALATFEEANRLDRNFSECHGAMAVAKAALGDVDTARREIEIAKRLDPNGLSAVYAEALLRGETRDRESFLRVVRGALEGVKVGEGTEQRTLAELVLGKQGRR